MVLARTRNKSLDLKVDEKGLYMDATLQDDITEHKNIFNAIKTQLIDKQSFAFTVEEDSYDYDTDTRTITDPFIICFRTIISKKISDIAITISDIFYFK